MTWKFLDYVDDQGTNIIKEWVRGLPPSQAKDMKAAFTVRLQVCASMPKLGRPYVGLLGEPCVGLLELIFKAARVQWRPLMCYGPGEREVTILAGATERGDRIVPASACGIALDRKKRISDRRHVTPHDYS